MKIMENGVLRYATQDEIAEIESIQIGESTPTIPQIVSRRQLLTGLALIGWITEQEAVDSLATGAMPEAVETVINSLPQEQRFVAQMKWIGFQNAYRDDDLVRALANNQGKTKGEVDEFFLFCSEIE